ncbi:hypothetical protein ACL6C3_24990 [Capilliphycus salinus ALCB114379]|uniref:hypothetical protein n=1 Tax=Capilliphycus salinus TaxID=2768948 RepID=UPI0039A4B55D
MSILKKTSETLNLIGAKLKPATQPRFWGPISVTAIVVAFIWQVSEHPEWFELDDLREAVSNSGNFDDRLSQEDRSIAADIDSSAVLLKELEGPQLLPYPINEPINAAEGVLDQARQSGLNRSTTPSSSSNPLLEPPSASNNTLPDFPVAPTPSDSNNILNFNPTPTPSSPPPLPQNPSGLTPANPFEVNYPSATTAPEGETSTNNPLQAAMDQYNIQEQGQSNQPSSSSSDLRVNSNQPQVNPVNVPGKPTNSTPTSVVSQPIVEIPPATWIVPRPSTTPTLPTSPTTTTNSYQTNISITPPVVPSQPIIPPTRTDAAVTPDIQNIYNSYSTYPNVNSNGSYSAPYPNNNASPIQAYPGYSNNTSTNPQDYQVNQNSLIQSPADQFNQMNQQRSYSVPRPIPGRRIGGGEINTFANP